MDIPNDAQAFPFQDETKKKQQFVDADVCKANETKQMKLNWRVIYLCDATEVRSRKGDGGLECIKRTIKQRKQILFHAYANYLQFRPLRVFA